MMIGVIFFVWLTLWIFLCFLADHFRSVEKATTMSKRIQERKKEEEPAVAKPRSVCLISTSLNKGQSSSFGPDVSNIPGDPQLDSGSVKGAAGNCERNVVEGATGNLWRDMVKTDSKTQTRVLKCWKETTSLKGVAGNCNGTLSRAPCLTVLKEPRETAGGTVQKATCPRQTGLTMPESSTGCGKLQRKIEIQLQTTRLDHHNLQVTDYGYVEKVFTNLRRKLNRTEDDEMFDLKTNVLKRDLSTTGI